MGADLVTILRNFSIEPSRTFTSSSDDVLDGCITPGTYRLLRFDFLSHNAGNADLNFGPPPPPPPFVLPPNSPWVWSPGHGHYHLRDFNDYALLNLSDQPVRPGFKQAFCLMDIERTNPSAPRPTGFFTCSNQGVSAGWSDVYDSSLPCQFATVDGVADGEYRLLATTNVSGVAREDRLNNNSVVVGLRLQGNNVTQVPLAWRDWQRRGGILVQPPKVVSWGPNRLDVFGVGTDNALYHMAWNGSSWSGWNRLGGILVAPVDAVAWGPNRLDVFGVGTDNALYHMRYG